MKTISRLMLIGCIFLLSFPIYAQPVLIMVTEEWAPFRINDESSVSGFTGIDIELVTELARRADVKVEIQRHPWARSLEMLRNGQADFISGLAYTAERAEFAEYIQPAYLTVQPVFYAPKGQGSAIRSYEDLYGKKIGHSIASAYFEPYNSDTRLEKVTLATEAQILQMLVAGRLDLAVGTNPNMAWDIARHGYREVLELTAWVPPVHTDLFLAFSKKSAFLSLLPKITEVLSEMIADGTVSRIAEQYR